MKSGILLNAIGEINEKFITEAEPGGNVKPVWNRRFILIAAVLFALVLSGFTVYKLGWFDPWLQKPSADPAATVQSAIENQIYKDYTINVRVDEIVIDDEETTRIRAMYTDSELAKARGWNAYLTEHFVVVWARYYVEYDHTKSFMDDGYTEQYFYLIENPETGEWTIIDNTSPDTNFR